ncbi:MULTISPECIES: carbohydrate-binding domain-containing protein [unclassified Sedimentibacter]|uniref:carbohydrate-binding domain-containing protein n=1 Tax=unclassified Sedimentibacter TaxID=2649220 RepID=UPI0027E0FF79|nr:carbohydrate-binding domain-containing protein [Sedimentibacter sp. MB35-C1]WMJ78013.1 carbohydrate-binding domain-containing protein [Sedimentibacter sp. MB35-C1]
MKKIIALILCTALLASCSANQSTESGTANNVENSNVQLNIKTMSNNIVEYEENDFYTDWEDENPIYITLNDSSAEVEGNGAEVNGNIITVKSPGTFVISGKLDDGQIIVDSESDNAVRLVLNSAEINCSDNSPVYIKNSGKTIISLAENTENTVTDGSTYNISSEEDEPDAAIFSKSDLTINGPGSLTVNANYNNGIKGKDNLIITGGNIAVNSVDDGLTGRDLLAVSDADITITSQGDGIKSTNDEDEALGNIVLQSGNLVISSGAKGMEAENIITVIEGKFTITSTDDSLHSNKSIDISGGEFDITSEDDGIHADSSINIDGGTINILKSYEGIESANINISDGTIKIKSSDDGINVAGGNDGSSINGRTSQSSFSSEENYSLNILGGSIYVDASGDGLDANGSIYMSGGTVIVNGPVSNGNGALDYDQKFEISGGLLIAAGSAGMAQSPSDSSSQSSVIINYSQIQNGGTIANISDEDGNSIVTFAPSKNYQTFLVSSPDIELNSAYQLYTGGSSTETDDYGLSINGTYTNGTKSADFTVSKSVLSITETGEESTGTFMPGQRGAGGKGRGMGPEMNGTGENYRPEAPGNFEGDIPEMPQNMPDFENQMPTDTTEN